MIKTPPIYLGQYSPLACSDIRDLGLDITAELADGDTVSTCDISVEDAEGTAVAGAISGKTVEPATGVSYTFIAPDEPGALGIIAVFTLSDGERITKTASIRAH